MNLAHPAVTRLAELIAARSAAVLARVDVDAAVLERGDALTLRHPGRISANGSARMIRAADGWLALNLPRESDIELVPAWLGRPIDHDPWDAIETHIAASMRKDLLAGARLLGLAVAAVAEVRGGDLLPSCQAFGNPVARPMSQLNVLDLSTLWAGPLCAAVLARSGATVTKVESIRRPDTTIRSAPALDARLNGLKLRRALDFADGGDRAQLRRLFETTDIVVTSARPRAFVDLDLSPPSIFAANPGLIWVAISGYGWVGDAADRIAFGDDAAAAGGLVRWMADEPHFAGDAIADPLTGLAAAAAAFAAIATGGGVLIDAALARTAAGAVAMAAQTPA